jgi:hypothetical protein
MTRAYNTATTQQNSGGAVNPFVAGKNKILNGDMSIWQRGTSITLSSGANGAFGPDRFIFEAYGSSTAATATRQTFTLGTAPVSGYESQYFARLTNFATATAWQIRQRIENVQTFAGQTVTFSFWAKASTALTGITYESIQNFGSGGSTSIPVALATGQTLSTSWTRYSITTNVASIAGKTIGASSYIEFNIYQGSGATNSSTIDTWGWQVEAGPVATPFQTATGTIQGELAACQRYYFRYTSQQYLGAGHLQTASLSDFVIKTPITMRSAPTYAAASGTGFFQVAAAAATLTYSTINNFYSQGTDTVLARINVSGFTAGQGCVIVMSNAGAWVEGSAEL